MSGIWPKESAKCSQVIDFGQNVNSIEDKANHTIDSHLFSRTIQLISSDKEVMKRAEEFIKSVDTLSYHLVKNIPIHVFVDKILINGFVKSGKLSAVSIDKQIDLDNCLALLPNGLLVLSVKESTYRRIGIVGKKSILYKKKNCIQKYLIEIDLNHKNVSPGTKFYQRTDECLRRSGLVFDIFIKWEVVDEELKSKEISSMSIQNFFSYLKTNSNDDSLAKLQSFRCLPSVESFVNKGVSIPTVTEDNKEEDIQTLIEWFGAQMCRIDCDIGEDPDVSSFGISDSDRREDINCLSISGFFTCTDIKALFAELKKQVAKSDDNCLNAIIVHGFEEAAVTWKGRNNEHSKNLSGENLYGIGVCKRSALVWRVADEYDYGVERL